MCEFINQLCLFCDINHTDKPAGFDGEPGVFDRAVQEQVAREQRLLHRALAMLVSPGAWHAGQKVFDVACSKRVRDCLLLPRLCLQHKPLACYRSMQRCRFVRIKHQINHTHGMRGGCSTT